MSDWSVILGSSSGFGEATARELAGKGINIYGIHLDRRAAMERIDRLVDDLKSEGVQVVFRNMSATDEVKRQQVISELKSFGDNRVKILLHSLAFGALKPVISENPSQSLSQ